MKLLRYTVATGISAASAILYNKDKIARDYVIPYIYSLDPEKAHNITIKLLSLGISPKVEVYENESLKCHLFGKPFKNPVGLAAGFDKNAVAYRTLYDWGFSFIEVGTMTPLPQEGNQKPRIFRFENSIKNRCGLNNDGIDNILPRLFHPVDKTLGVNIGINNDSENIVNDYMNQVISLNRCADYTVINISCPNVNHNIQGNRELVEKIIMETRKVSNVPLVIKISPDIGNKQLKFIANKCLEHNIDGIIIGNTARCVEGGLSGEPIRDMATQTIRDFYRITGGKIPIIGCGGIFTGRDAYEKIKEGASLVQIYSAMIFNGPEAVNTINTELAELLKEDKHTSIAEAVGKNHTYWRSILDTVYYYLNYN